MARIGNAIVALKQALEERLESLTDEATDKILTEIPAYRSFDEQLRRDVPPTSRPICAPASGPRDRPRRHREDLLFVRPHAARRAKRVSVTEFVQAFYVGERVLWDTALALAHDDESRRAALVFASHLPRYFEVATTHAAEVYLEIQEHSRRRASGSGATCSRTCSPAASSNRDRGWTQPVRLSSSMNHRSS